MSQGAACCPAPSPGPLAACLSRGSTGSSEAFQRLNSVTPGCHRVPRVEGAVSEREQCTPPVQLGARDSNSSPDLWSVKGCPGLAGILREFTHTPGLCVLGSAVTNTTEIHPLTVLEGQVQNGGHAPSEGSGRSLPPSHLWRLQVSPGLWLYIPPPPLSHRTVFSLCFLVSLCKFPTSSKDKSHQIQSPPHPRMTSQNLLESTDPTKACSQVLGVRT